VFTGLIQGLGRIAEVTRSDDGVRLSVDSTLAAQHGFDAEVMNESLERSSLRDADAGTEVNLELPLRASDRLGGHVVQGHVDGVGTVRAVAGDGFARRIEIEAPVDLLRYVVSKGSVAVDGVSLTVADLDDASFTVSLIPETLERTNLGQAQAGTRVNLEVDVLAKYVEKLLVATR